MDIIADEFGLECDSFEDPEGIPFAWERESCWTDEELDRQVEELMTVINGG